MTHHLARTAALSLLAAAALLACGDNLTHPTSPPTYQPGDPTPLACVPNLDGRIDAEELAPALGVPVSYLVNAAGTERAVDLVGAVDGQGRRVWDWASDEATDQLGSFEARAAADGWYGDRFPADAIAVALTPGGAIDGVYRHDSEGQAFLLLGIASTEEQPAEGQTLLIYDPPIELYRFPLEPGDSWVSAGEVSGATFFGLPYAGKDTYEISVDGAGHLSLPDLTFTQALRVRTRVTVQPSVGAAVSRRQVSFLFECFGEVARATSRDDEPEADFTTAAEVRRLGLD